MTLNYNTMKCFHLMILCCLAVTQDRAALKRFLDRENARELPANEEPWEVPAPVEVKAETIGKHLSSRPWTVRDRQWVWTHRLHSWVWSFWFLRFNLRRSSSFHRSSHTRTHAWCTYANVGLFTDMKAQLLPGRREELSLLSCTSDTRFNNHCTVRPIWVRFVMWRFGCNCAACVCSVVSGPAIRSRAGGGNADTTQ